MSIKLTSRSPNTQPLLTANNTGGGLFGTPQPGLGRGGGGLANPGGGGLFGRTAGGGLFGSGGGGGLGGGGGGGGLFSQTPAASQSGGLFGGGGLTGGLGGTGLTGGLGGTGTGLFQTPQSEEIMITVLSMTLLPTPPPPSCCI